MKKYIVYKYRSGLSSGDFCVVTISEAFALMGSQGTDLPKLKGQSVSVNQIDIERELVNHEIVRLTYKDDDWIITKIWE